jgi:hypothetical protein
MPTTAMHHKLRSMRMCWLRKLRRGSRLLRDRRTILFLVLGVIGLGLRLFLILNGSLANKADLRNYYWAGQQAAWGNNPYRLWAQDLSGPRSDLLPFELALLALVVRVGGTPLSIRLFFVLVDVLVLCLILLYFTGRPRQRMLWFALYAVGVGPLYFFTMTPSDKPIQLGMFLAIMLALRSRARWGPYATSILTGLLGAFKWLGLWFAVPVALGSGRGWIERCLYLGTIGGVFCLGHLPWFPDWKLVYEFRSMRFGEPFHSGLAVLLQHLGLPMVKLYYPLMATCWGLLTWFYLRGWLNTLSAMVLSIISIVIWAPDSTAQMVFFLTLMVLLVTRWDSAGRAVVVFVGTSWMALMSAASIAVFARGLPGLDRLRVLSGAYGSINSVIWPHLMLCVSLYWLVRDQHRSCVAGRPGMCSLQDSRPARTRQTK